MSDNQKHSEFGGSVAYRVINCKGSVRLLRDTAKSRSKEYDATGTWAHALLAYCLEQGYRTADSFLHTSLPISVEVPKQHSGQVCGENLVMPVNVALAEVFSELDLSSDAELFIEEDFDLPIGEPGEVFGRGDVVIWHPSLLRLRVFDYKHGVGSAVDADENDQGQFYTAGVLRKHPEWKPQEVIITILQPRHWRVVAGTMEPVKDWLSDAVDTELWLGLYALAVDAAKQPDAPLTTGPWCDKSFCDARAVCPAKRAEVLDGTGVACTDVAAVTADDLPKPATLDLTHLSKVAANAKMISAWADQCLEYLEGLMLSQNLVETPHWKIVDKVGKAKWVEDRDRVVGYAQLMYGLDEDQVAPRKLSTITDMVARLKASGASKADIDTFKLLFTIKESSGRTIAPSSDRRPAVDAVTGNFGTVNISGN